MSPSSKDIPLGENPELMDKVDLIQTLPAPSLIDVERRADIHALRLEHRLSFNIVDSALPEDLKGPPVQMIPEPELPPGPHSP